MRLLLQPWHLLLFSVAGWVNRQQQDVIAYLRTENQVLREKLGKKRILLSDDQRRRLAAKGRVLGRKLLDEVGTLFTPDTILRWHRQLIAAKWDYSDRRKSIGRPRVRQEIVDLILRFARENPRWGYDRIQGALANLGYHITDTTVGNILKDHGIEPAPDRQRSTTLPPRSPNLNAYAERFVLSLKQECLDRMIFFGERSLRNAVQHYLEHYHTERNHQGIDNRRIEPSESTATEGDVACRERLGGMLNYYHRRAA